MTQKFLVHCDITEDYTAKLQDAEVILAAEAALEAEELGGQSIELSVAISDDAEVQELNLNYRGVDSTTDVLSFGSEETTPDEPFTLPAELKERRYLGDIIISFPQAERQAPEFNNSPAREVQELVIHGVFHLLGYDHELEADREVMRAKEEAAAKILGEMSKTGEQ